MSKASDRRRWQHMAPAERIINPLAAEAAKNDPAMQATLDQTRELWANNLYVALVNRNAKGQVSVISVHRHDRQYIRDWRHLQAIKNDIAGPEVEAVELFPAESRLMDMANETWIWVLDGPAPFGWKEREIGTPEEARKVGAVQRPVEEGLEWPA